MEHDFHFCTVERTKTPLSYQRHYHSYDTLVEMLDGLRQYIILYTIQAGVINIEDINAEGETLDWVQRDDHIFDIFEVETHELIANLVW